MLKNIFVILLACWGCVAAPIVYHVSCEDGADTNPGTRRQPFKTLNRAVTQAQRVLSAEAAPDGVRVEVGAGRYEMSSGVALRNIRMRNGVAMLTLDGKGRAVLSGGIRLAREAFKVVSEPSVLHRLQTAAIGHVAECDVAALTGGMKLPLGVPEVFQGAFPFGELLCNGVALPMATWPNAGWTVLDAVVAGTRGAPGQTLIDVGSQVPLERWRTAPAVWLQGFWCHDWYEEIIRVASVDVARHRLGLNASKSRYGIGNPSVVNRLPRRFRAVNMLEELDSEGEWCVELRSGRLYAWLPKASKDERLEWTRLEQPFFTLTNCTGVRIRGFVMENSRCGGVLASGGNTEISNCELRNLGGTALELSGTCNTVSKCDIHDCAGIGVSLKGGNEQRLWRGDSMIEDCHIWRIGQRHLSYHGAIHIAGVGNTARNNLIHDLPHTAIFYSGNEHRIQRNDIFAVCLETGDSGALYTGRSWASRGNRIEENYIHDLGGFGTARGVYLDDCDSGDVISGNVFVAVPEAVAIGGGRDNHVENNIFVLCSPALSMDSRGTQLLHWNTGDSWDLHGKLQAVHYDRPPWSKAYPELADIMEDSPAMPLHNSFSKNIVVGGIMLGMADALQGLVEKRDNWLVTRLDEVGFADWTKGDFEISNLADVQRHIPEFTAVPFRCMGVLERVNRPVKVDCRAVYTRSMDDMKNTPELVRSEKTVIKPVLGRVLTAGLKTRKITIDGRMDDGEWSDASLAGRAVIESDDSGNRLPFPCLLYVLSGDDGLYVAFDVAPAGAGKLVPSGDWKTADGVSVQLQQSGCGNVFVLRGFPDGRVQCLDAPKGIGAAVAGNAGDARAAMVSFGALDTQDGGWTCEWLIPWSRLAEKPQAGGQLGFNAVVFRAVLRRAQYWRSSDGGENLPVLKLP